MASVWQTDRAVIDQDSEIMAAVLEARHGLFAAEVADFFVSLHTEEGDNDRSCVWAGVAERVRNRQMERLQQA